MDRGKVYIQSYHNFCKNISFPDHKIYFDSGEANLSMKDTSRFILVTLFYEKLIHQFIHFNRVNMVLNYRSLPE